MPGQVRVLRNDSNLGFARACNQGASAALGDFLVFLNNDTIPHEAWLTALLDAAHANPQIAVVGSKLLYPDGRIQHAGIAFGPPPEEVQPFHIYSGERGDALHVNRQREFQAVTAACMLVRREVFFELGGFDEAFVNSYEDVDFCLRVRERGYRIVYAPGSVVTHYESKTPGRHLHDDENFRLLNGRWAGRIVPDYLLHFEADGQDVPFALYTQQARSYYARNQRSEGDTSLIALLDRLRSARATTLDERASFGLMDPIMTKEFDRVLTAYIRSRTVNLLDVRGEFFLAVANLYYKMNRRSIARHYLAQAILSQPSLLFRPFCLTLMLKATALDAPLRAARTIRNKTAFQTSRWLRSRR